MTTIFLALGSNIGTWARHYSLSRAIYLLERIGVTEIVESPRYETEPVGVTEQGKFINSVIQGKTGLEASGLLLECLTIERQMGRVRKVKNGPRTLDIDILLYGDQILEQPDLVIPHPRLHLRSFVLQPLARLAPELTHPVLGESIQILWKRLGVDSCGKEII